MNTIRAAFLSCLLIGSIALASAQETVPPPPAGLKGNHNYYFYNDGKPILGLIVTVKLTQDVVCDDFGFHIQLNANSPPEHHTKWQQYCMGFKPDFKMNGKSLGPIVGSSIEYFVDPKSDNFGTPPIHDPLKHLPGTHTLPAGAKFVVAILYEGNDVFGADFTYVEKEGKDRHNWMIPVPPPNAGHPVPKSVRTPIIAFQLDIVGESGGNKSIMKSGAGQIIYSSSAPMTVLQKHPPDTKGTLTMETANSAYSALPAGPSNTFTQTFTVEPDASN